MIWDVCVLDNGDVVTAGSDGKARVWTRRKVWRPHRALAWTRRLGPRMGAAVSVRVGACWWVGADGCTVRDLVNAVWTLGDVVGSPVALRHSFHLPCTLRAPAMHWLTSPGFHSPTEPRTLRPTWHVRDRESRSRTPLHHL